MRPGGFRPSPLPASLRGVLAVRFSRPSTRVSRSRVPSSTMAGRQGNTLHTRSGRDRPTLVVGTPQGTMKRGHAALPQLTPRSHPSLPSKLTSSRCEGVTEQKQRERESRSLECSPPPEGRGLDGKNQNKQESMRGDRPRRFKAAPRSPPTHPRVPT